MINYGTMAMAVMSLNLSVGMKMLSVLHNSYFNTCLKSMRLDKDRRQTLEKRKYIDLSTCFLLTHVIRIIRDEVKNTFYAASIPESSF